ncbi:MAG: hypothetical protein J7454_17735 [Roseiflexus sp.]|nr:hypothetical protein [Roseiflexus sp.]
MRERAVVSAEDLSPVEQQRVRRHIRRLHRNRRTRDHRRFTAGRVARPEVAGRCSPLHATGRATRTSLPDCTPQTRPPP